MEEYVQNFSEDLHLNHNNRWDIEKLSEKIELDEETEDRQKADEVMLPKMEEYVQNFSEDLHLNHNNRWEKLSEKIELDEEMEDRQNAEAGVQLLPRRDVTLFGTLPKMERRIFCQCKMCKVVFNPRDILSHKNCSEQSQLVQQSQIVQQRLSKKKVKSKGNNGKKAQSRVTSSPPPVFKKPRTPPPLVSTSARSQNTLKVSVSKVVLSKVPKTCTISTTSTSSPSKSDVRVTSATSKVTTVHSSKSSSSGHSHITKTTPKSPSLTPMDTLPISSKSSSSSSSNSAGTSTANSSSSNRYNKKAKRSSNIASSTKVATKEYDPDIHCGVVEGNRGPCTRSITCSNHRIQLRKLVPGRSKDIHQLIAERKAAKEKELKHTSSPCSYTSPNGEEKEIFCQNTSYVPIVAKIVSTIESTVVTTSYVPIMPKVSTHSRQITTSVLSSKQPNVIVSETESTRKLTNGYINEPNNFETSSQDGVMGTVPVVYMPMSPISIVSPVQFVKIGNNMICLESPQSAMSPPIKNKSVFLPLPNNSSMKLYKSHPKPVVLPTFGARKVGGAILLANPRIESQRNELLTALKNNHKTVNNHRVASLPNHTAPHRPNILKVKSTTRTNSKRSASDKLVTSDNKRVVPDVNGFILHADVSESADAPQSSNCIQEKIALLNMK